MRAQAILQKSILAGFTVGFCRNKKSAVNENIVVESSDKKIKVYPFLKFEECFISISRNFFNRMSIFKNLQIKNSSFIFTNTLYDILIHYIMPLTPSSPASFSDLEISILLKSYWSLQSDLSHAPLTNIDLFLEDYFLFISYIDAISNNWKNSITLCALKSTIWNLSQKSKQTLLWYITRKELSLSPFSGALKRWVSLQNFLEDYWRNYSWESDTLKTQFLRKKMKETRQKILKVLIGWEVETRLYQLGEITNLLKMKDCILFQKMRERSHYVEEVIRN